MLDQPAIFLRRAGEKSRYVDEGDEWNIEAIAETDETRRLAAGVGVEHAGKDHRLVGNKTNGSALDAAEAGDDIFGEGGLDLEEIGGVDHLHDQILDVVGLVGAIRDQAVQRRFLAIARV